MGFNATVVILLDGSHEISNDPNFGYNLIEAIKRCAANGKQQVVSASDGRSSGNVAEVIEVHHSAQRRKILVTGNTGFLKGMDLDEEDEEILGLK